MKKSYIGINSAAEKGYAVGIYDSETHHAILESSGFQPNFARVIKRVTELAILYPESCKEGIHVNFSPLSGKEEISSWEREDAIKGLQKLIGNCIQSSPKCKGHKKIVLGHSSERSLKSNEKHIFDPLEEKGDHSPYFRKD